MNSAIFALCDREVVVEEITPERQEARDEFSLTETPDGEAHVALSQPVVPGPHAVVATHLDVVINVQLRGEGPSRVAPHVAQVVGHETGELSDQEHDGAHRDDHDRHVDHEQRQHAHQNHHTTAPEQGLERHPPHVEHGEGDGPLEALLPVRPVVAGLLGVAAHVSRPVVVEVHEHVDGRRLGAGIRAGGRFDRVSVPVQSSDGEASADAADQATEQEDENGPEHDISPMREGMVSIPGSRISASGCLYTMQKIIYTKPPTERVLRPRV